MATPTELSSILQALEETHDKYPFSNMPILYLFLKEEDLEKANFEDIRKKCDSRMGNCVSQSFRVVSISNQIKMLVIASRNASSSLLEHAFVFSPGGLISGDVGFSLKDPILLKVGEDVEMVDPVHPNQFLYKFLLSNEQESIRITKYEKKGGKLLQKELWFAKTTQATEEELEEITRNSMFRSRGFNFVDREGKVVLRFKIESNIILTVDGEKKLDVAWEDRNSSEELKDFCESVGFPGDYWAVLNDENINRFKKWKEIRDEEWKTNRPQKKSSRRKGKK